MAQYTDNELNQASIIIINVPNIRIATHTWSEKCVNKHNIPYFSSIYY